MRALVTGGAGFIGSHVAEYLLRQRGVEVVVLDDLSGGRAQNVPEGAEFYGVSVTDPDIVDWIVKACRVDVVYHLAAFAAEGLSHHVRRFNYETNLLGTVNVINAAIRHGVARVVYVSSAAVYGDTTFRVTEDDVPRPIDPYGIAKLAGELDLQAAGRRFGLEWSILRPFNVYGERQNLVDPYRNVVGIFMRQALAGEALTVYGTGNQSRAFSYVGDVAPVIAEAGFRPCFKNAIYNVGAQRRFTLNELAKRVGEACGVRPSLRYLPARPEAAHVGPSCDRIQACGFRFATHMDVGLERMAQWAKTQTIGSAGEWRTVEVETGLPVNWIAAPDPSL
jgi:UDP-glucose 4-epimerase